MTSPQDLKSLFLLEPDVVFLNHGSYGAIPRPVFEVYQAWQRRLERQPVRFFQRELPDELDHARQVLGRYLCVDADDLIFVPNATYGVNIVARSLPLAEGDEVITTDQEYGACNTVWSFLSRRKGFRYLHQPISLPATSREAIVDQLWQAVTPRTKVIYLSHITSPTALTLPVEEICARARAEGILTVIDGAHAPGQLPLDLTSLGADFYTGNCHKWLCSPKGDGFLHTRHEHQHLVEPLVVGWGVSDEREFTLGSAYLDHHYWLGTNDFSGYLSIPAAIDFQAEHYWAAVRRTCHELLRDTLGRISTLTGLEGFYGDDSFYQQMGAAQLPLLEDAAAFKERLYEDYRIEIPCSEVGVRISVQGYNSPEDLDLLVHALERLLPA
jgi:isopenicillin-N epimerase